ncbi:phosphotransferase [Mechercharimyces sp. CAU 1602]|uniref:phosphotransferase n=1 Tax=Mechercharimyces sp. CAU 1602 TaxID=2973933 RepID=UPI002161CBB3|nr:phosphotransferase [Mechercharimyces sp. CAU 1602]MCS1351453.1 phosphotransferase [Mechercharimyces sp. CAU 1602]
MKQQNMSRQELQQVFTQYGFTPHKVTQINRIFRVETDQGTYALKWTKQPAEKLMMIYDILQHACEKGYRHVIPWVKTESDEAYVMTTSGNWYATPWIESAEQELFAPSTDALLESLAQLHQLSAPLVKRYPKFKNQLNEPFIERWKERKEKTAEYFHFARKRDIPSPLDHSFLEQASYLEKAFDFSIRGVERFLQAERGKAPRYTLCHARIHPKHVLISESGWYWIDFDHAVIDTPVRDIATFYRQFGDPDREDISTYLSHYEEESSLKRIEEKLLAVYLAYPLRPYQVLKSYYGDESSVNESYSVGEFDRAIAQLGRFQEVIQTLWQKRDKVQLQERKNKRFSREQEGLQETELGLADEPVQFPIFPHSPPDS